jgi:hypothetical protein
VAETETQRERERERERRRESRHSLGNVGKFDLTALRAFDIQIQFIPSPVHVFSWGFLRSLGVCYAERSTG